MLPDLRAATEWAAAVVDGIDPTKDLARPTPCSDWDVRTLVIHVVAWNRLYAAGLLGVDPPDDIVQAALATTPEATDPVPVPDLLGEAPGHAYRTSAHELIAVFSLAGTMEGTCPLPLGSELPAGTVFTMVLADNIVHGWDLAVATGQHATIPAGVLTSLERAVANLPIDRVRGSRFADPVPAPPGADRQTRLLAHLGRRA